MTTVGAKVRITGTSGGAVSALNATTGAAGRLNTGLGRLAGVALTAGAGVLGFGAATESARRLVQLARESVVKYSDSNIEAAERLAGTREKLDELQESVGRAIIGGDNLEEMTGALNIAFQSLSHVVDGNSTGFQNLALNGFRFAVNGALSLAKGATQALAAMALLRDGTLVAGDGLAYGALQASAFSYELDTHLKNAIANAVEGFGVMVVEMHPLGRLLGGIGVDISGVEESTSAAAEAIRGMAGDSDDMAETLRGAADEALAGMNQRIEDLGDNQLQYGVILEGLNFTQLKFNESLDDGTAAASSFRRSVAGVGEEAQASTEWVGALADRVRGLLGEMDRLRRKREDQKTHAQDMIKAEIDLQAHLDAIKTEAFDADQRRRDAEQVATSAAIDGTLAGFGRLASGNDKLTKALNIAAGARLAGQAVFQLNTGVGYALAGSYAQGVALIAQSVVSFAEAAKLGFGGGKKGGGGARQTTTTVNQTNVFAGPVDSDSSQGFLEQLQSATRAGALEGAR
jgi:hypothetical protein